MSIAIVYSRAQVGIEAPAVTVEVHLSNGLPSLSIVGLPETAVKESKDRVRSAILNSRFEFPLRRITVNLAPADLPKEGGRFDLPIALGILAASGQINVQRLPAYEFFGELALTGELRPIRAVLPAALTARDHGRALVTPLANAAEAALVEDLEVLPAPHLLAVCAHLNDSDPLPRYRAERSDGTQPEAADMAEVKGQEHAKRAMEVAATGGHNLLMIGPPGTGKSMLAARLPGILPPMSEQEALETAAIASISGNDFDPASWRRRRFRAPHHTASAIALVGGGSDPRPGEISLAHNGVLFLDELPEFDRRVLETLREPLESGVVTISRAARQASFPARFQLVAAMNPCPCGHLGDGSDRCRCTAEQVQRYRRRVSGPFLDRIDLQIEVPALPRAELLNRQPPAEDSNAIRQRVIAARAIQLERAGKANAHINHKERDRHCRLADSEQRLLERAMQRLNLSARGLHRILKVARSIADLAASPDIDAEHLTEAISLRRLDIRKP